MSSSPHADAVRATAEQIVSTVDAAHAAGLEVPPLLTQAVAMVMLGAEILRAQETGEAMRTVEVPHRLEQQLAPHGRSPAGFPLTTPKEQP